MRNYNELNPTDELHPAAYVADAASACNDYVCCITTTIRACFFTDPDLNPFLEFNAAKYDDLVITVFTVANNQVSDRHPDPALVAME